MLNPSLWPFPVASLGKGDVLDEKTLVTLVGLRPGHPMFLPGVLQVRDEIDRQLRAEGKDWAFKVEGNTLLILSDADAAPYLSHRQRSHRAGMRRCHRKQCEVDTSGFGEDARREHARSLTINGAYLAAAEAANRRAVGLANYERNTPGRLVLPGAG